MPEFDEPDEPIMLQLATIQQIADELDKRFDTYVVAVQGDWDDKLVRTQWFAGGEYLRRFGLCEIIRDGVMNQFHEDSGEHAPES